MKQTISRKEKAFSLVEVTLAMAIAAVALVSIIGMLPQGMKTMRDAGDRAIQARIHQQLLGELQMTPFGSSGNSPLEDYDELEIYYDAQGEEIGDSSNNAVVKGSFEHIYTARVAVPEDGEATPKSVGGSSFDGFRFSSDRSSEPNQFLRPAIVEIAAVGGRGATFDWDNPEDRKAISVFQSYVVKMGQDYTN
ncbi:MAG: Verru_Chthon cassette protein B [Verrucomicrobiales bacterium]|nr:Verru_Chthon cassette protein B [Verrucomicrobiales bacterium]